MTTQYKVVSRHTKEMLLDFIKFTYRINHPKSAYRIVVMAIGFILIGAIARGHNNLIMIGGISLGILALLILIFRKNIAFMRLSANDELYRNQTDIEMEFGQAGFYINDNPRVKSTQIKYGEITQTYKDKTNYYLLINNQDLQILPYKDFVEGGSDGFENFIFHQTNKQVYDMAIPLRERIKMMNELRKQAEIAHDKKIEDKKKKKNHNS